MSSVTERINKIKQPRGGYVKPSQFTSIERKDNRYLNEYENIHATIIGIVVDYLTRYMLEGKIQNAFSISYQLKLPTSKIGFAH